MTKERNGVNEALIVVPLDGSELAEGALPYAMTLAGANGARLLLVTVWEEGERALIGSMGDAAEATFAQGEAYWRDYLSAMEKKIATHGFDVATELRTGDPAGELMALVVEREPALLVMATHGRSGLGRWRFGSVTSKLAYEAPAPTLMVGPKVLPGEGHAAQVRRIIVPLDGSPLAETAIRPALELAEALDAELVLAQALRWATQVFIYGIPDVNITEVDAELSEGAEAYLARVRDGLPTERAVETEVLHGPPADALTNLIDADQVDLVVMASHTRAGVHRAMLGSVADRLLQASAPVLLVRPEEVASVMRGVRGRYCHNCGRASAFIELLPDDVCRRCEEALRVCDNCAYYNSETCMLKRPELRQPDRGRQCPYFQFLESESPTR